MQTGGFARLLAVDDDPDSAELVVRVAERCGYEAFATSDSRGVVSLTKTLQPTILAVDICMPNVDAPELFRRLHEAQIKAQILIVSGQDIGVLKETQMQAEALGLQVPYILQKPVDYATLREMLNAPEIKSVA